MPIVLAPMPATKEEMEEEILSLRTRLIQANQKLANMAEKAELTKRSLAGQLKELRLKVAILSEPSVVQGLINHFEGARFGWWSKQDIIAELKNLDQPGIVPVSAPDQPRNEPNGNNQE